MKSSALKIVFQSDSISLHVAEIDAYQPAMTLLLQRLSDERLVERLHRRDPALWYPAAETQARIRSRLGWLDLPAAAAPELDAWLALLRARQVSDVLYVAPGDAGVIARLWRDLAGAAAAPGFTLLDTIEPAVVLAALEAAAWERTAVVLPLEPQPSPDADALLRVVLAARESASADLPPLVLAAPDTALPSALQGQAAPVVLPLPPDVGARFGALSPLGWVPAALLGWSVERLQAAALTMRGACQQSEDLATNPGVWLGTVLAVLAQQGRDKLILLATPDLLPAARWIAAFLSGSLSKHGRGFVAIVQEAGAAEQRTKEQRTKEQKNKGTKEQGATEQRTTEPTRTGTASRADAHEPTRTGTASRADAHEPTRTGTASRADAQTSVVALRLAGVDAPALDGTCAALAAGQPLLHIELADREAMAALIVCWQVAVATAGVVLGLNPFDEPDTDARHAYLWRRLAQPGMTLRPLAAPLKPAALAAALQQLQTTIRTTGCLVLATYLPPTAAVAEHLHALRSLLARRFGVHALLVEPLRDAAFATQVLHAGRPCAVLLLTAEPQALVAVPDLPWLLNDLRHERIAADVMAWDTLRRSFVYLDLGADPAHELRRYLDLLR